MMRIQLLLLSLLLLVSKTSFAGEDEYQEVVVLDPYIELHTGAGRGYPIFYVVERGEKVLLLKRRTDWVKVRSPRGKEGWVSVEQMSRTLQPTGEMTQFDDGSFDEYQDHRWEVGFLAGDFGGANILSGYGAYSFTPHISAELWLSQILGNFSDGWMINANLTHTFFPKWRASPFFSLGTGVIDIRPKATLVDAEDRRDQVAIVGFGAKAYVTRRFVFRAEYKNYLVFTSRDENEDVNEWKLGFSVFF